MKKRKKITLVVKAILKGKKAPDFGFGKGVIATHEMVFTDERGQGFQTPLFAIELADWEARISKDLLRFEWTEK